MAKGPMPAMASSTTSSGRNRPTSRWCSRSSREFQYTWEVGDRGGEGSHTTWATWGMSNVCLPEQAGRQDCFPGVHRRSTHWGLRSSAGASNIAHLPPPSPWHSRGGRGRRAGAPPFRSTARRPAPRVGTRGTRSQWTPPAGVAGEQPGDTSLSRTQPVLQAHPTCPQSRCMVPVAATPC